MSDEDLKQEPEAQEGKPAPKPKKKGEAYKNIAKGPVFVCGHRVAVGGTRDLTDDDRKDEKGMKRLARAVELGLVEKV